jgi:hypothetical protein
VLSAVFCVDYKNYVLDASPYSPPTTIDLNVCLSVSGGVALHRAMRATIRGIGPAENVSLSLIERDDKTTGELECLNI